MMMKRCLLLLGVLAQLATGQTEQFNHVKWTATVEQPSVAPGGSVVVKLDAEIDPEWHMYSLTTPPGPIPTTVRANNADVVIFQPPPIRKFDPNFNADTETYEGHQTFYARIALKKDVAAGPLTVTLVPRY